MRTAIKPQGVKAAFSRPDASVSSVQGQENVPANIHASTGFRALSAEEKGRIGQLIKLLAHERKEKEQVRGELDRQVVKVSSLENECEAGRENERALLSRMSRSLQLLRRYQEELKTKKGGTAERPDALRSRAQSAAAVRSRELGDNTSSAVSLQALEGNLSHARNLGTASEALLTSLVESGIFAPSQSGSSEVDDAHFQDKNEACTNRSSRPSAARTSAAQRGEPLEPSSASNLSSPSLQRSASLGLLKPPQLGLLQRYLHIQQGDDGCGGLSAHTYNEYFEHKGGLSVASDADDANWSELPSLAQVLRSTDPSSHPSLGSRAPAPVELPQPMLTRTRQQWPTHAVPEPRQANENSVATADPALSCERDTVQYASVDSPAWAAAHAREDALSSLRVSRAEFQDYKHAPSETRLSSPLAETEQSSLDVDRMPLLSRSSRSRTSPSRTSRSDGWPGPLHDGYYASSMFDLLDSVELSLSGHTGSSSGSVSMSEERRRHASLSSPSGLSSAESKSSPKQTREKCAAELRRLRGNLSDLESQLGHGRDVGIDLASERLPANWSGREARGQDPELHHSQSSSGVFRLPTSGSGLQPMDVAVSTPPGRSREFDLYELPRVYDTSGVSTPPPCRVASQAVHAVEEIDDLLSLLRKAPARRR